MQENENENKPGVYIGPPEKFTSRIARKLVMKKSLTIAERSSWSNMAISVVKGICRIEFDDDYRELKTGDHLTIASHVPHQIRAITDLSAVLTFDAVS